jgi:hypothetical protein
MGQLTAVSHQQFGSKTWISTSSYSFAAKFNIVPVVAGELSRLVPVLPLGFVMQGKSFQLAALTSLQPGANLFVARDGRWLGSYIPAALRGYPFRLVKPQEGQESILCFNESSGLLAEAGKGEAFFDETGAPSPAVMRMLDFLSEIERNEIATQAAVDALQAAGLIEPWPLSMQNGEKAVDVTGLFRIDESSLNVLDAELLKSLRDMGALALAYAQLFSINQLSALQMLQAAQANMQTQPAVNAMTLPQDFTALQDSGTLKFS